MTETVDTKAVHLARASRKDLGFATALALVFVLICLLVFRYGPSGDLLAVWLAGDAFAAGQHGLVYAGGVDHFTMRPPVEWYAVAATLGYEDPIYPFIYPPIWAWAAAELTQLLDFQTLSELARGLNAILMVALVTLAWRVAAPRMRLQLWLAIAMLVLMTSTIGWGAILENQPQIFVAFLTVLALERAESDAPRSAGLAMALAASIKLYPLLLALLWLAAGRRQAFASFIVAGAGIAALSVVLAGWPLHLEFLRQIRLVAASAILTPISYTADGLVAQIIVPGAFTFVPSQPEFLGLPVEGGWMAMAKPGWLLWVGRIAQLLVLARLAVLMLRSSGTTEQLALWPAAMVLLSLFGPMAWSYHYLAPAAFAPLIVERLGLWRGGALLLVVIAATFPFFVPYFGDFYPSHDLSQAVGTLAMALLAFGFLYSARRPSAPLRPRRSEL